jgi:flagellar biosynthetic protein FliR
MSSPMEWTQNEFLTFFIVLVRTSVLFAILPLFGDRIVPATVKVMLSVAVSMILYPILVGTGQVNPSEAAVWGATSASLIGTIATEAIFSLAVGFSARIVFDAIQIGGDIAGNFMGFASASQYDPHQESNTQVISRLNNTLAMLLFLAMNGHHLMLQAALSSFAVIGIGKANFGAAFGERLISLTTEVVRLGLQFAAPMAIAFFGVNLVYGIISKAMPQLNILVLSFSVSASVGLVLLFLSLPEFQSVTTTLFSEMGDEMIHMMQTMAR